MTTAPTLERLTRWLDRPVGPVLTVFWPLAYALVCLLTPPMGALLLILTMGEIDPGPVPPSAVEGFVVFLVYWGIGVLLSAPSLVWVLWGNHRRYVKGYAISWSLMFIALVVPILLLSLLAARAHPPEGLGAALGMLMIVPIAVALPTSTILAILPGLILAVIAKSARGV